jgi:act minimal PKS acyl carrier protein
MADEITFDDLKRVLKQGAGTEEGVDLSAGVMDTDFEELGYDSLALLETAARLEREFGVQFDDEAATDAKTPREFLSVANAGR